MRSGLNNNTNANPGTQAEISVETRQKLKSEFRRTGYNPRLFVKGRTLPAGLDARTINQWMRGTVRRTNAAWIAFVLESLATLPDARGISGAIHPSKAGPRASGADSGGRLVVSDDMRKTLHVEQRRTGVGPAALEVAIRDQAPGLTRHIIAGLRTGKTRTVSEVHWKAIIGHLRDCPDGDASSSREEAERTSVSELRRGFRSITKAERERLRSERRRTGISGEKLLDHAVNPPATLSRAIVQSWLSGATTRAHPDNLNYVFALYARLPDCNQQEHL